MEEKPVKDPLSIEHANSIAFVAEYDDGSEDYFVLTVTRYGKEQVITSLESLQNGKEVGA